MSMGLECSSVRPALFAAGATLLGLGGGLVCGAWHQCMAGHMQHPPYGLADYGLDLVWPALLLFVAWRAPRVAFGRPRFVAWAAVAVVVLRFWGSYLDVVAGWLPLLGDLIGVAAWLYLFAAAVRLLWRTWRPSSGHCGGSR